MSVTVSRRRAARARLAVTDSGPGLVPEQAEQVFERFYRADPSRTRASGGAGLGLSIVAAVAAAHGGSARAESSVGGGATFIVELPLADVSERRCFVRRLGNALRLCRQGQGNCRRWLTRAAAGRCWASSAGSPWSGSRTRQSASSSTRRCGGLTPRRPPPPRSAFIAGALNGYWWNGRWTFAGGGRRRSLVRYAVVQGAGAGMSALIVAAGTAVGLAPFLAFVASMVVVTSTTFVANRSWAFAKVAGTDSQ